MKKGTVLTKIIVRDDLGSMLVTSYYRITIRTLFAHPNAGIKI